MQRSTLVAARVLAALGAVFWGYFFFGVQDTLTVLDEGEDFAADYLMESGWGLLFLFLVGAPLVGLAVRPRTTRLVAEVIAAGVAVAMGAGLAQSAKHLLPAAGLIGTALLVAVLARPELDLRRPHADLPLLIWTLVAIGPGVGYAWHMAHSTTNVTYTAGLSHYPVMAALGIAVPLIAGVLTVGEGSPGSRLVLASLFITVAWMGVESVVYPHRQGSFGTTWGWLAAGWAVVLLALGLRRATQPAFDGVRARPTRSGRSAA